MNMLPEIIRQTVESKPLISNEDVVKVMYPFEGKPSHRGGDGITIVGSCNGLICASHARYIFYVWNPCTGEYKVIRSPFGFQNRSFGFGYDSQTCDYKFVSVYCHPDRDVSEVEIYSLGSDSWENYHLCNPYIISGKHGVFLNGAVHCVPDTKFEIWEMKDYGVRESWSKVLQISQQELMPTVTMGIGSCQYIRRVESLKDGEILLEIMVKDGRPHQYRKRVDVVKIHLGETKRRQNRRDYIKAYVKRLRHQNRRN
ncbi:F-box/kelch-repeat protein At3g23880-like [Papaver somniferum]|uniref:F-box/kelch-repeat protein At3g23880-like n=1 Tax=Papaver somniferum TaxID=3469 RepID=UPI000E704D41|nr:F-box/kelch-repeat protein At3g23880-like [Papaver somniferum]